jgi:hypothetical protein
MPQHFDSVELFRAELICDSKAFRWKCDEDSQTKQDKRKEVGVAK